VHVLSVGAVIFYKSMSLKYEPVSERPQVLMCTEHGGQGLMSLSTEDRGCTLAGVFADCAQGGEPLHTEQVLMCTVRVLSVGAVIFYVTPILTPGVERCTNL